METLDGTIWDIVIAGTGLPQSLLALSLSRSGKHILHLDRNDYYGGNEAALSLAEAEAWAEHHAGQPDGFHSAFSHASVSKAEEAVDGVKLSKRRAYSLALAPQVVHSQSKLLSTLVSSRLHNQLDFQAVGSWFIVEGAQGGDEGAAKVSRVPSSREDIFRDTSFDLKSKRALVKFLRFVQQYEDQGHIWEDQVETPFSTFLHEKFGLPVASHGPLLALTLESGAPSGTSTADALPKIARHLRSIGVFGPGFGAVLPKWGGLAEIAQVACRAGAVGGGVYVLNKGIRSHSTTGDATELVLSDGEKITTTWLAGCADDLPSSDTAGVPPVAKGMTRSIAIVTPSLRSLFPPTSEGGVTPAGAVVVLPSPNADEPPVHILVHSNDSGECPSHQSILYASVALPYEEGQTHLTEGTGAFLRNVSEDSPHVLWSMQYYQTAMSTSTADDSKTITLSQVPAVLGFPDSVLDDVKLAWQRITGETDGFMEFEAREGLEDEDND